jgi:NitT/TauT family transport system permease protein
MSSGSQLQEALPARLPAESAVSRRDTSVPRANWKALLVVPAVIALALGLHLGISGSEPKVETQAYTIFLCALLSLSVVAGVLQLFFASVRRWMAETYPILAVAIVLLCVAEVITTGLRLLPLPYFPSPARILQSAVEDRAMIWDSTWHSLLLLVSGYALGVLMGLVSGVCIGWFAPARYWGMPLVKVLGPLPATAWIPLALVLSPSARFSAIGLIALAVWFPVTMLTSSGISNTRASYLDVARTLGASRSFLIFRVAIPAAMPNIFIGVVMGLGAAFLTLVVAETVGVKSGLGWYLSWAKEWAEYGKVYAALVIMAVFFSTIMTALFKMRDRVLVWQKGTIKW